MIRPSRMVMMRWACAATSGAWVTMTMVIPEEPSCSMRSRNRLVDAESRLPVGSSAKKNLGFVRQRPGNGHPLALAA